MKKNKVYYGNCLKLLKKLDDNSIDSIVTDPPYNLTSIVKRFSKTSVNDNNKTGKDCKAGNNPFARTAKGFMGMDWDGTEIAFNVDMWKECLRVLKPGGYVLAFSHPRTYHRMACAIEDAGFEIRDMIEWFYGSGMPKSHDISKAIDKKLGKKKAKKYKGQGTALKPAHEPICSARKPLSEKTVANNVLKWGTGGLNIDDCRISTDNEVITNHSRGAESAKSKGIYGDSKKQKTHQTKGQQKGRFPANLILDESMGSILDEQNGIVTYGNKKGGYTYSDKEYEVAGFIKNVRPKSPSNYGDSGGVSRYFYCAKASKKERGEGNTHPTVKPLSLMRYLCSLVTPPNGIVLDPFLGSGTTAASCIDLGFNFIGFDFEKEYVAISNKRIREHKAEKIINSRLGR